MVRHILSIVIRLAVSGVVSVTHDQLVQRSVSAGGGVLLVTAPAPARWSPSTYPSAAEAGEGLVRDLFGKRTVLPPPHLGALAGLGLLVDREEMSDLLD